MITRYSDCHFAEAMRSRFIAKHVGAEPQESIRCSFCGEPCELVPQPSTLEHDLELTLRRWKDGDCTLDDMFIRVNNQLQRSYNAAFTTARETLQADGEPQYVLEPMTMEWTKTDTQVITAAKNSPDTTTKAEKNANNPS